MAQTKSQQTPWLGSPVRSSKAGLEVASTPPGTFFTTPVLQAPSPMANLVIREVAMMCPQPQRALWSPVPVHTPYSPTSKVSPCSDADEASEELQQMMAKLFEGPRKTAPVLPSYLPAFDPCECRPLSSASTRAGTPAPGEQTSPIQRLSPDSYDDQPWEEDDDTDLSMRSPQMQIFQDEPVVPSPERKLFVGGIPQCMTQDDLFSSFNQVADVKKAWVQRDHHDSNFKSSSRHKHRGFGFVIFRSDCALEQLLGAEFSRYIVLEDGTRLEVKRAVSSRNLASANRKKGRDGPQSPEPPGPLSPATEALRPQSPGLPCEALRPQSHGLPWLPAFPTGEAFWPQSPGLLWLPSFPAGVASTEEQRMQHFKLKLAVPASLGGGASVQFDMEITDVRPDGAGADADTETVFRLPDTLPLSAKDLSQMSFKRRKELERALLDAMPHQYTD